MDAITNEQPSTSSSAKRQIKINSATNKSSTNNTASVTAAKDRTTTATTTPTPTLAQIGRQTSHNFRLSQISDSGAESGDEQTRLIRSPSSRSHKFIIIPATPPTPSGSAIETAALTFRPTISASSLSTLAAAIQKTPPSSQQPLQRPRSVARQLYAAATAATAASPTLKSVVPTTVNQSKQTPHSATHSTPATSLTRSPQSQSDVVHQATNTKTPPATIAALLSDNSAGVTFTIEDCESEGCGGYDDRYSGDFSDGSGVPVYDATLHPDNATRISSIKSASKLAPSYTIAGKQTPLSTSTTALVTASTAPSATAVHPFYRSALASSETSPYTQGFSRGRSERSSTRSVVSGEQSIQIIIRNSLDKLDLEL